MFVTAAVCAFAGLDFGHHWDEYKHLEPASRSVAAGSYLPERYIYPSLCYDLILLAVAAHAPSAPSSAAQGPLRPRLAALALTRPFKLRVRGLFALLTLLATTWTYLLVRRWRGDAWEAGVACALVGLSWEIGYHARWIAPDGLVLSLGALTILGALSSYCGPRRAAWLTAAALAAGLACSAKYPAGLLLVPVLLTAAFGRERAAPSPRLLAWLLAVFALACLATTPGAILDWSRFRADVSEQIALYASGHFGYTVSGPVEHLRRALAYLGLVALSPYVEISAAFSALAVLGTATLLRADRRGTLIFLSFPVLYLAYFSLQKVMLARNLLVLIPFAAVLAAAGWSEARRLLPRPSYRALLAASTVLFFLLNLGWLVSAAVSIRRPGEDLPGLAAYIDARPKTLFRLSPKAAAALDALDARSRPNTTRSPHEPAEQAVLYASEVESGRWSANRRGYTAAWFGPYEVNFDYYPTWQGRDRLVVLTAPRAAALGF